MSIGNDWLTLIYATDPGAWIDAHIHKNELNKPFSLYPHQRTILQQAFSFDADGKLPWDTVVWSCVKKSGKTTIEAILALWWGMTQEPPNEIILVANDLEQTLSRAFATIVRLMRFNPEIDPDASISKQAIQLSNGTIIKGIASEYSGAAGSNHGMCVFDELWAYTSERAQRLFEELTVVPTRLNSVRLIGTYAGYEAESQLLRQLYTQGVDRDEHPEGAGTRLHPELPLYANTDARLFTYWDHTQGRFPWQTEPYYQSQKKSLRPAAYLRFHENRWASSSDVFITPELWDGIVDPSHRPLLPNKNIPIFVGVDASLKHDSSAVCAVGFIERDGHDLLALAQHRIWQPTPEDPLDIQESIEAYLRQLHSGYRILAILCDPWQLADMITRLEKERFPIEAYPQTVGNLTRSGQAMFDLLHGRNLVVYRSGELRQQALQTIAQESSRGWRISKEKSSNKIDALVAMSMACVAALESQARHHWLPVGQ